jgi:2-C-methyl-D-erythritol 4-phosphate cytidylyltransferase
VSAIWAVVPAAGSGSRMAGAVPKQYLSLRGRSILDWSVAALLASRQVQGCVVALPAADTERERSAALADPRVRVCAGGASRAQSVASGLAALPAAREDWVLVHDAARPCLPLTDLERLIERVTGAATGGLLAQPVTDTIKRGSHDSRVVATVDRRQLWRAQTPQMFRVGELGDALAAALESGAEITDEASAMELAGHPVQLVSGSAANLKVTYPADLALAGFWLEQAGGADAPATRESS